MGHWPCSDCCPGGGDVCTLLEDLFNRSNDTALGADWVEEAGDADIFSNTLRILNDGTQVIATTGNPGPYNTHLSVRVKIGSSNTARLFLYWLDSSNYAYFDITTSGITVGTTDPLDTERTRSFTLSATTNYTAEFCYNGQSLIGRIDGKEFALPFPHLPAGDRFGVGGSSGVIFDDFIATNINGDCETCVAEGGYIRCDTCEEFELWGYWEVEITGVTNGTCTGCNDLNGIYYLTVQQCIGSSGYFPEPCGPPPGPTDGFNLFMVVASQHNKPSTLNYNTQVIYGGTGFEKHRWLYDWGPRSDPANKPDCDGVMDGLNVPLQYSDGKCSGGTCVISRFDP
jgi:hypothetical protein